MELWRRLYNTVWLAFFCCALLPRFLGPRIGLPIHGLLGLLMTVMALGNATRLAAIAVPPRLQRITKVMGGIAIFQLISGIALGGVLHLAPNLPFAGSALRGMHVICALAILAQASSVATGYDMWEEKEIGPAPAGGKA